jgi:predicted MFS family arabinose efflux permease
MTAVLSPRARSRITLASVCLAILVLPASLTGSSVALPSLAVDLGAGLQSLQWVVNAYNLTFACFLLVCGSLADIVGRRRVFAVGGSVFVIASLVSSLASSVLVLDIARAAAGVGAAAVMTSGSALLATAFQGVDLGRAFALLGSAAGAGLALGPSIAGLVVGHWGWRWVFVVHAVAQLVALGGLPALPNPRVEERRSIDWAGAALFTVGLFLLVLGVVQSGSWGWSAPATLGVLAVAATILLIFVLVERRQASPMFEVSLLTQRRFVGVCLVPVALSLGFVCLLVYLPTFLTGANGASPDAAGATMMLLTLPILGVPIGVGALIKRGLGMRAVMVLSLVLVGCGVAWLTVIHPGITVAAIAGPLLVIGAGMGISAGTVDGMALSSVAPDRAGMAAGIFNTGRLASEAVCVAALGATLAVLTTHRIATSLALPGITDERAQVLAARVVAGDVAGGASAAPGSRGSATTDLFATLFTDSFRIGLWAIAVACIVTAAVVHRMLRPESRPPAPESESATDDRAAGATASELR